jgi:hypothetical protein
MDDESERPQEESAKRAGASQSGQPPDLTEETQGRDVIDQSREAETSGRTVVDRHTHVEVSGTDVIDHSRVIEEHGVEVIDEGHRPD